MTHVRNEACSEGYCIPPGASALRLKSNRPWSMYTGRRADDTVARHVSEGVCDRDLEVGELSGCQLGFRNWLTAVRGPGSLTLLTDVKLSQSGGRWNTSVN